MDGMVGDSFGTGKGRGRGRGDRGRRAEQLAEEGPQVRDIELTSTGGAEVDKESPMQEVHETAINRIADLSRNYEVRLSKGILDQLAQKHPEEIAKLMDEFKKKINPHPPGSSNGEFLKSLLEACLEDALGAVKKRVADMITLTEVDQDVETATKLISSIKAEYVEQMDKVLKFFVKGRVDILTLEKKHRKIGRDLLQWLDQKMNENFEVDGAPQQVKVELESFMDGYWKGLRTAMEMQGFASCCNQENEKVIIESQQALGDVKKKPEEHEPIIY